MDKMNQTLKTVNLSHDYLFGKVMADPEVCRCVLEKILGFPIRRVEFVQIQKTIDAYFHSKGIRMDVFAKDEKNSIFNIEMQIQNKDIAKRARYYQDVLDLDQLRKGDRYSSLNKTYIIFICLFDMFGRGLHKYDFQYACDWDPELKLNDGTYKIFLNTRGTVPDVDLDVAEFLKYVENSDDSIAQMSRSQLVQLVHNRVKAIKNDSECEVEFMAFNERIKDIEESARNSEKEAIAFKMLGKDTDLQYISEVTGLSVEEIMKIKDKDE